MCLRSRGRRGSGQTRLECTPSVAEIEPRTKRDRYDAERKDNERIAHYHQYTGLIRLSSPLVGIALVGTRNGITLSPSPTVPRTLTAYIFCGHK